MRCGGLVPGHQHDLDMRSLGSDHLCQPNSVHRAGYINVGQQHVDRVPIEGLERDCGVWGGKNLITGVLKQDFDIHEDKGLILDN